ncbi:MAG TPA: transporter [Nitrospiria bacterium]|nr:transporter [Nitrospiria bacterium]
MFAKKTSTWTILLIGIVAAPLFFTSPAHAIRPFLATETAIPIEPNKSLFEGGLLYEQYSSHNRRYTLSADLRYGLITNLDFEVIVPYLFSDFSGGRESNVGDVRLRAKVRFLKGREANPLSIAGMIDVKFPSASRDKGFGTGEPDIGIFGIASKEFFPVTVHLNVGYTFVGDPPGEVLDNVFSYSFGAELQTMLTGLDIVGELSGRTDSQSSTSPERLDLLGGVVLGVSPEVSVDFSVFFGLIKDSPDFGLNGGFAYRF